MVVGQVCLPHDGADRAVLASFYHATGGQDWVNSSSWLTDTPIWGWHGVETDSSGRVTWLELAGNNLQGVIPAELGALTHLESIDLSNNGLTGTIPVELANLSQLSTLDLDVNDLSGEIPPELGNLSNLYFLDISFNGLSGSIPPELGNLSELYFLRIAGNNLTGNVPPELGKLSNLGVLHFAYNQLEGEIPESFSMVEGLYSFEIQENLGLCAPRSLQDWIEGIESYLTDPNCPVVKRSERE